MTSMNIEILEAVSEKLEVRSGYYRPRTPPVVTMVAALV